MVEFVEDIFEIVDINFEMFDQMEQVGEIDLEVIESTWGSRDFDHHFWIEFVVLEDRDVSTDALRERNTIQGKQFTPRRCPANEVIQLEDLQELYLDALVVLALADVANRGCDESDFETLDHLFRYAQIVDHFYKFRRRQERDVRHGKTGIVQ